MISKNLAQGIVLTAPSPATSGTSVVMRSGEGAYFDTPPFLATAAPPDQLANPAYAEIVLVTAKSTDTLTIVRAKRGTTAKSIAAGWIIANGIYTENVYGFDVTVSTAAATATKVGTTSAGDYSPTLGDIVNVTFSNGNTVTTPTLNIDGSGAKNIRLGNANVTTAFFNTGSAITLQLWYDGTYFQLYGSLLNTDTTYTEISAAEIINTASTTVRLITGRRAEDLMVNEATKARTLASKTLTSPVINTSVSGTAVLDEDNMASNSDTKLATQQSIKAYVDTKAGTNSLIRNEVPGGSVNSSNVTFTLASTPATGSLRLYRNGVRLKITDDYTLSGTTITMVSAPLTGDKLLADYETTSSVYSVGTNSTIVGEVPSGSVNGSNATFTLARSYIAGSLEVMINGLAQARTTHFTETTPASGIFTMGDAPLTGDVITVNYQYNLNPSSNADTVDGYHGSDLMPIGSVIPYAGINVPSGNWLFAYGQAVSRTTYADLFTALSTTYGVGDGSTTFNLPDMRGRVAAGQDDMGGSSANRLTNPGSTGGMDGDTLGNAGGQEAHVQTTGELATHTHKMYPAGSDGNIVGGGAGGGAANLNQSASAFRVYSNVDGGSAGSSTAFNVVQPTIILNYIIKAL